MVGMIAQAGVQAEAASVISLTEAGLVEAGKKSLQSEHVQKEKPRDDRILNVVVFSTHTLPLQHKACKVPWYLMEN